MVHKMVNPSVKPRSNGCPMSVLVGTGDNIWAGLYLVSSTIGFVLMITLLDIFYINKFNITAWWYKGLLFVVCMVASVLIFGGLVVVFWNLWGEKAGDVEPNGHDKVTTNGEELHNPSAELKGLNTEDDIQSFITTRYGTRPDFKGTIITRVDRSVFITQYSPDGFNSIQLYRPVLVQNKIINGFLLFCL